MTQTILLWALAGGVLNRFSGWADYLPGRNIYYAAVAALGLVWYFYGPVWGALVFISFLAYRLPGWYKSLDIGAVSGSAWLDATIMFLRGLYWAPVFAWAAYAGHTTWPLVYLVWASIGATAAYAVGNYKVSKIMRDPFWFIEFAAGCSFGFAVGLTVTA